MLTSVYEAPWKTQAEHNTGFQKAEVFYAHAHQLYRQVTKHGSIDTVIFVTIRETGARP